MTNQVNQAFEKWWYTSKYTQVIFHDDKNMRIALDGYEAATKASESEINSLKERVAELQSHLSSQSIEIANNDVTLESYAHKVAELQASNNQLRGLCEKIYADLQSGNACRDTMDNLRLALSSTPAQSLAEHDNEEK